MLDIIFRNGIPITAKAGGSMLNTAVSLGRSGINVQFIGKTGNDPAGRLITRSLEENHVGTTWFDPAGDEKTTIALAFLDANSDATYSFYSSGPPSHFHSDFPEVTSRDVVLFGSFFSLNGNIREKLIPFLEKAGRCGALVVYDPNFRMQHSGELGNVLSHIMENISLSGLVRGSDEDFLNIFADQDAEQTHARLVSAGNPVLICTKNRENVRIFAGKSKVSVPVPEIQPVSTIGAGDAFNAGLIYSLVSPGIDRRQLTGLSGEQWKEIAMTAIRFAGNVCMSLDNYTSVGFANAMKK